MNFWINFWTIFFVASLALFASMAIVVSIGGFFNIRSLLRTLARQTALQGRTARTLARQTALQGRTADSEARTPRRTLPMCFGLLIPASLTLGSGDPSAPSIIAVFFAVASLFVVLLLFGKPTIFVLVLSVILSVLIFFLALLTFVQNPLGMAPTYDMPLLSTIIYYFVARAGAAVIISVIAFVTTLGLIKDAYNSN